MDFNLRGGPCDACALPFAELKALVAALDVGGAPFQLFLARLCRSGCDRARWVERKTGEVSHSSCEEAWEYYLGVFFLLFL